MRAKRLDGSGDSALGAGVGGAFGFAPGEIAERVYGGDADGGLEDPENVIRVTIARLRKQGAPIVRAGRRGYAMKRGLPPMERAA